MLKQRPDRQPDLKITNLRMPNDSTIEYDLTYSKIPRSEDWQIPHNSTFLPTEEIKSDTNYVVWSEEIDEPYTTTKGKQRTRKRHDWCWIEEEQQYVVSTQSDTARKIKQKLLRDAHQDVVKAQSRFDELFEQIIDLPK